MPTLKPLKSLDRVTSFKLFTLTNQIFISQVYGSFLYGHFTELYTSSVICGLFMCRLIILRHKCVYIFILQPMYLPVFNGYCRFNKEGFPFVQQSCSIYTLSYCNLKGFTYEIACKRTEAGLIPGSPFTKWF